nr:glycosyltransferase [Candidatus Freyarchaeota archaeon]
MLLNFSRHVLKAVCESVDSNLKVVLSPTNEGFGHAQRAEAIASRLIGMKDTECLVFTDQSRVNYLSTLNLKYNSSLHGIKYVYRKNGDLNTLATIFRLMFDSTFFPLDFFRALRMGRGYDVFVNDYNPHLTMVPGMRTINISHYLPYKYRWSDLRMNFYSTVIERPIMLAERARSCLRLSESFIMDFRPELVDLEKVFPPIARDVTRAKSEIREELGLRKRNRLVMVTGRPYRHSDKGNNNEFHIYRKVAWEHPDINFLVALLGLDFRGFEDEAPENMTFMSYIPDIYNYLNASDLIVARAGFGTISEAIIYGVPLIIFQARGHMEKRKNALIVQDYGYGKIAENVEKDIVSVLEESSYMNHEFLKLGNGLNHFIKILNETYS